VVGADRVTQQIQTFVVNAGEAEINGAEIELLARSDFGLDFATSLGITHARYTEFDPIDPSASSNGDPKDRRLPNTPTYTLHFGLGYTRPIGRSSALRLHADWTHIGSSGTDVADSRILRKGKHGELAATLTWMLANGKTEVALFGNNLLDREYVANGIDFADSFGHATRFYAAPRTYGIELRRQF
jgi:iron complex outermembrane receptor protein